MHLILATHQRVQLLGSLWWRAGGGGVATHTYSLTTQIIRICMHSSAAIRILRAIGLRVAVMLRIAACVCMCVCAEGGAGGYLTHAHT